MLWLIMNERDLSNSSNMAMGRVSRVSNMAIISRISICSKSRIRSVVRYRSCAASCNRRRCGMSVLRSVRDNTITITAKIIFNVREK
jgi:hypothetical protein